LTIEVSGQYYKLFTIVINTMK